VADEQPEYLLGDRGVNIVASPLHTPEHGLLVAKNVEFKRVMGIGGIGTRDGIRFLNEDVLAGPVMALVDVPLDTDIIPGGGGGGTRATGIYLAINPGGGGELWLYSADGITFSLVPTATLPYGCGPIFAGSVQGYPGHRVLTRSGVLFFVSVDPVPGSVSLVSYDGATVLVRVPALPAQLTVAPLSDFSDMIVGDGGIYFVSRAGSSPANSAPYFYNPTTGAVTALAIASSPLETGNVESLTAGLGFLWWNDGQGQILRAQRPGGAMVFFQTAPLDVNNAFAGSVTFEGLVYIAESAAGPAFGTVNVYVVPDPSSGLIVSDTEPVTASGDGYGQGIVYGGDLYWSFRDGTVPTQKIKIFSGGAWSDDLDLVATFSTPSTAVPEVPFIFGADLFWPYKDGAAGFLLKKSGGVWSQVLTNKNLRGFGGVVS